MARVTGFLSDFQQGPLAGLHPTLHFQPSGPAVGNTGIYAPENAVVVPIGSTGYFEVELQPTDGLRPAVYYTVTIRWGSGRNAKLPWVLSVPAAGGILAELLKVPATPGIAWVGLNPPLNPSPGMRWYNPDTGDLKKWSA